MRKSFAVAAMLLTMAGAASAQGRGGTPEQRDSTAYARAFNGITLNADVTAKAKTIISKAREESAAIDATDPDVRTKRMAVTTKRNADLKALLTSDADKAKFDENTAMGRGRGGLQLV
jgi:hypothetical protein